MYSLRLLKHLKIHKGYPEELYSKWPSYLPEISIEVIMKD